MTELSQPGESAVRLSVKPVFIGWVTLLSQVPIQIFLTLWLGGVLGSLFSSVFPTDPPWVPFALFGGLTFIGIPLAIYLGMKFNYAETEYKFFDDRLEFDEGFLTLNKKTIMLRDVKEVTLRRGILQRFYGLGSIYLATLATGSSTTSSAFTAFGFGNVSGSGIVVRDITRSSETYEWIRQLVEYNR
jgi:membrane protein YdbS with pleckstrin-like domain